MKKLKREKEEGKGKERTEEEEGGSVAAPSPRPKSPFSPPLPSFFMTTRRERFRGRRKPLLRPPRLPPRPALLPVLGPGRPLGVGVPVRRPPRPDRLEAEVVERPPAADVPVRHRPPLGARVALDQLSQPALDRLVVDADVERGLAPRVEVRVEVLRFDVRVGAAGEQVVADLEVAVVVGEVRGPVERGPAAPVALVDLCAVVEEVVELRKGVVVFLKSEGEGRERKEVRRRERRKKRGRQARNGKKEGAGVMLFRSSFSMFSFVFFDARERL